MNSINKTASSQEQPAPASKDSYSEVVNRLQNEVFPEMDREYQAMKRRIRRKSLFLDICGLALGILAGTTLGTMIIASLNALITSMHQ